MPRAGTPPRKAAAPLLRPAAPAAARPARLRGRAPARAGRGGKALPRQRRSREGGSASRRFESRGPPGEGSFPPARRQAAAAARGVPPVPPEPKVGRGHGWLLAAALGPGVPAPARMLAACGMQRCHQEALKKNRVILAKQLVLNVLVEHMVEKDIITTEMVEMIQVRGLSPAP